MNRRPGEQILQNDTDVTIGCLRGWKEPDCQTCAHGWREPDCDAFAPNFGPPGQCDRCKTGWAGDNCDSCDHGWTGPKCNACEFGFSTESRCTECIQNGHWSGNYYTIPMTAELTFEGSACTKLASGMFQCTDVSRAIVAKWRYEKWTLCFHSKLCRFSPIRFYFSCFVIISCWENVNCFTQNTRTYQLRIQNLPRGKQVWGKNQLFAKTLTENCMKMKEIGPREGVLP